MTFGNNINFPFNYCDTNELININNSSRYIPIETPKPDIPSHIITEQAIRVSNLNPIDDDGEINLSNLTSCKYYSCQDYKKLVSDKKNSKNVNIFHNNFNGLELKFGQFHNFLTNINSNLDVITITETSQHITDNNFKTNVNLKGYDLYSTPTNTSKGGSAIYIKNKFNVIERTDLNIIDDHYESIWIEIKNTSSKNVIVGCIYRHPHDNIEIYKSFLEYLEPILRKVTNENKEIYLCGDFNSDILKIDYNNSYKHFYELISSYSLAPFILLPTRIQGDSATIVDNIFTNNSNNKILSGNIVTDFSDHFSQFVSILRPKLDLKSISIYKRDYSKFSEQSFRDDVSIQTFNNDSTDVNVQFNDFYYKLIGCVERHAPLKKSTPKEIKLDQKPWITNNLLKMIKIKNKLFFRKKRQPNNENVKLLYNIFRNRVNRELKKSKKEYYSQYFEDNYNNSKKIWEGIRSIININKSKSTCINQLNVNEKIIDNPKNIVEALNNFFVNVGPNTEKSIPHNPVVNPEKYLKNRIQHDFIISNISTDEVMDIINQLESKSTGPNSIPVNLLKLIPDLILAPLCKIISNSFITGIFPDALKNSKIIAIHKG